MIFVLTMNINCSLIFGRNLFEHPSSPESTTLIDAQIFLVLDPSENPDKQEKTEMVIVVVSLKLN